MASYGIPEDLDTRRAELIRARQLLRPVPEQIECKHGPLLITRGSSGLVYSAPHEVEHVRGGQPKFAEGGTAAAALWLAAATHGSSISTFDHQLSDPNDDRDHPYREALKNLSPSGVIDLHMMQPRGFEVCLGLGTNRKLSWGLYQVLTEEFLAADIRFATNWPFGARGHTITAAAHAWNVPAVQIEVAFDCYDESNPFNVPVFSALLRAAQRV
jgi:hypothetical protein